MQAFLKGQADEVYAAFQRRILPGTPRILGVRMGALHAYVRAALKDGRWQSWPFPGAEASYEEMMLYGLALCRALMPFEERTRRLERFAARIDNWGVCDSCCAACHFLREDRQLSFLWLKTLLKSDRPFTVRFALVCFCDHFVRESGWTGRVLEAACQAGCPQDYYARMALAWLLAEAASVEAEAVAVWLRDDRLAAFVRTQAARKIGESRKISAPVKIRLREAAQSVRQITL